MRTVVSSGHLDRVTFLLVHLADQARSSEDLSFAVRAQSQAATLLWPYDRERARTIFRRAFASLAPTSVFKPDEMAESYNARTLSGPEISSPSVSAGFTLKQQLRTELLNHIAGCDPELAEDLARALVYSIEPAKEAVGALSGSASPDGAQFLSVTGSSASENEYILLTERREVLIGVALRIVEREPHRAMSLGQLSLPLGISPNFARLLTLMRAADHSLADLLFSSAVAHLERSRTVDLTDLHILSSYLISSIAQPASRPVSESLIVRFLNLTINQMMRRNRPSLSQADQSALDRSAAIDQASAAYFLWRGLGDLFARYLPDRLPDLQRKVAELSEDEERNLYGALDRIVDPSQMETKASGPNEIVYEARTSSDRDERNALFARAALAWLGKGDTSEAQAAAAQIADADMRDRVLAQIARRQSSEGRIDDAVAIARRIEDDMARVGAFVRLADAALSSGDRVRATELLNEAEQEAARAWPSIARAQSLLTIVSSFSAFDPLRAFESMQTAVKSINDLFTSRKDAAQNEYILLSERLALTISSTTPARTVSPGEVYNLDFEGTLAALAQVDFDRALLLAQQLDMKDASVIAQLAVCQGGLTVRPAGEHSTEGEDEERNL